MKDFSPGSQLQLHNHNFSVPWMTVMSQNKIQSIYQAQQNAACPCLTKAGLFSFTWLAQLVAPDF